MSEIGLSGDAAASQPIRRRPWKRNTLRGFADHQKIPLRRVLRLLRAGQLPVRVGWVDKPTPIREYARLQGIDRLRARKLYQQGILCPMVMPHPRGRASWPADSGIAELVLLYAHAERQLRAARREADAYAWRLSDLRRKAKAMHKQMHERLKLLHRRLRLLEGALRSRDALLSRLKHEAELGAALAGADKTIEAIVTRTLGAEAWEAMRAARNAGMRRKLAATIRAAGRAAECKEKAAPLTAALAAGSDADRPRGLSTPTADAAAGVEQSSNEVSHHGQ